HSSLVLSAEVANNSLGISAIYLVEVEMSFLNSLAEDAVLVKDKMSRSKFLSHSEIHSLGKKLIYV
ncbi:MAG: hypothetical protein ACK55I_18165, partial [bacterium]